eukprot:CAMPEP_0194760036 /NCGR_PEP_ID=MMETSP0323_2-20130528/13002_1 /TAXON_ID=2866 ORGANISM="Crypthecodinium cohnii, Strain Seligo" /NCGR_SAMPLE_ID=MMETSP0323_2 /ASSEMBLY_ACC=CAM_ASM_000346 /LENGTH=73 /DNA_ID=CAMNT_0039681083 /DNA_START=58 /DNA_END=276 /DNA_ORIENTATION=+
MNLDTHARARSDRLQEQTLHEEHKALQHLVILQGLQQELQHLQSATAATALAAGAIGGDGGHILNSADLHAST